ncbi:MAG: division/cell wall cluster transcriptional repressor MraZ [Bacteroidota bacterium]
MTFFKGMGTCSMDEKGRINIPARMRKSLNPSANDCFVVTRGVDKCIEAYPMDVWVIKEENFNKLNQYNPQNRNFLRKVLMWSEEVSLDPQQRIAIPKKLQLFAGIHSKVTVVGMGDHLELWDTDLFENKIDEDDEPYEVIAEKVMTAQLL